MSDDLNIVSTATGKVSVNGIPVPDDLRTRIAAALKTANDRVAGFIGYDEMADAVITELATTYVTRKAIMDEIQSYATDHENLGLAESAQDLIDTAAEWDQWK